MERRGNLKTRSCGVSFVAVHNKVLNQGKASESTAYHCDMFNPLVQSASLMEFQITPLYRSHWELPHGLYTDEDVEAISRSVKKLLNILRHKTLGIITMHKCRKTK